MRALAAATLALAACAKSDERWLAELSDPDPFVRALAAIALVEPGARGSSEPAERALPVLLETVDRSELGLRPAAAAALAKGGANLVPGLLEALAQGELMTIERREAVLGALAAAGPPAIPAVVEAMRAAGPELRRDLGLALVRVGRPAVGPLVEVLSKDPDPSMRGAAALLLGELGNQARNALSALAGALERDEGGVALAAAHALPRIDPGGADALPALEKALTRREPEVRQAASAGIAHIQAHRAAQSSSLPDRNRRGPER